MKMRSKAIAYLGTFFCIITFLGMGKKIYTHTQVVPALHVDIDPAIAQQYQDQIQAFIQQNYTHASQLITSLQTTFPCIQSVSLTRSLNKLYIALEAQCPVAQINADYVLTERGIIVPKDNFAAEYCCSLLPIIVRSSMEQNSSFISLYQVLTDLDPALFQQYSLVWHCDELAFLQSIEEPHFNICFNKYKLPDAQLFEQCSLIKESMMQRESKRLLEKKRQVIADIRFEHQIIVRSEMGGLVYG